MKKDTKKVVDAAKRRGWVYEHGSKHDKLRHSDLGLVTFSVSPSCGYAAEQLKRDIDRAEKKNVSAA